jgi:hypothetical protein
MADQGGGGWRLGRTRRRLERWRRRYGGPGRSIPDELWDELPDGTINVGTYYASAMSTAMQSHRPLTEWERRFVLRLLEPAFPGRDALRQQMDHVFGSAIDENGSLNLECQTTTVAPVEKRVPTEGEAIDRGLRSTTCSTS